MEVEQLEVEVELEVDLLLSLTQQTGYSEDPYSRPSPRLPLHHFSQRRMLASLLRREARRSQGDLEALARGQRFFSLHQFTLCCCMLFTTLRCQPPPHSHLEKKKKIKSS